MAPRAGSARLGSVTAISHVRPTSCLRFPASEGEWEQMPESRRHVRLCKALYEMLASVCAGEHTVGWDQFVYFDAADPRRKVAPDAFVKLGVPDHDFDSYLVWEDGTPELAFEVLSPSDSPERGPFEEKLRRYRSLGVRELVVINVDAPAGARLRVWDRVDQDLVERVVAGETTPCLTLGLTLLVGPVYEHPVALRMARMDGELVPTESEERDAAKARVRELEERLARR